MLQIFADKPALIEAAFKQVLSIYEESIERHNHFTLALAGGSTPKPLYEKLAQTDHIDWSKVLIFFGDERCVHPEHEDSNYRMARESLLDHVPIAEQNVYRMHGELAPTMAAYAYSEILEQVFKHTPPHLDLILLGMGDDAHTASLFPYTPALYETEKTVMAQYVGKLDAWRITLTPPVLNAALNIMFLASGEDKAQALYNVFEGEHDINQYPSQIAQPTQGNLWWFVDQAAARLLPTES